MDLVSHRWVVLVGKVLMWLIATLILLLLELLVLLLSIHNLNILLLYVIVLVYHLRIEIRWISLWILVPRKIVDYFMTSLQRSLYSKWLTLFQLALHPASFLVFECFNFYFIIVYRSIAFSITLLCILELALLQFLTRSEFLAWSVLRLAICLLELLLHLEWLIYWFWLLFL